MTADFLSLVRQTYDQPQAMARRILALGLTRGQAMGAMALAATLWVLVTVVPMLFVPLADPMLGEIARTPLALAAFQWAAMVFGAVLMAKIGKAFGGHGDVTGAMVLLAWAQMILAGLQAVQIVLSLVLPILALPVALFSLFSYFFLLSHFTAALHGFSSVGKVLGGILLTMFALGFLLGLLMALTLPVQNV